MDPLARLTEQSQRSWDAVAQALGKTALTKKVLKLERTRKMFERCIEHFDMRVCLPLDSHYVQHCQRIISMVPARMRFKIGVCFDPPERLDAGWKNYAYMNALTQRKDGVRYEGMIVMFSCCSRDVVNMLEIGLIDWALQTYSRRCANRKVDYDQKHCDHDGSDSAEEHGSGPHQCYLVWGPPQGSGRG